MCPRFGSPITHKHTSTATHHPQKRSNSVMPAYSGMNKWSLISSTIMQSLTFTKFSVWETCKTSLKQLDTENYTINWLVSQLNSNIDDQSLHGFMICPKKPTTNDKNTLATTDQIQLIISTSLSEDKVISGSAKCLFFAASSLSVSVKSIVRGPMGNFLLLGTSRL